MLFSENCKQKANFKVDECDECDVLKTVDTIGNCQSIDFTVGVSQHLHKITNL